MEYQESLNVALRDMVHSTSLVTKQTKKNVDINIVALVAMSMDARYSPNV